MYIRTHVPSLVGVSPSSSIKHRVIDQNAKDTSVALIRRQDTAREKNDNVAQMNRVLLTDIPRECMHSVMQFLNLKDGFSLRGTCRHFRFRQTADGDKVDALDVFRYCRFHVTAIDDFCIPSEFPSLDSLVGYVFIQKRILKGSCQSLSMLRELLANETFSLDTTGMFSPIKPLWMHSSSPTMREESPSC